MQGLPFKVNTVTDFDRGPGVSKISDKTLHMWIAEVRTTFAEYLRFNKEPKWMGVVDMIWTLPPAHPNSYDFYNKLFINQTGKALFSTDDGGKMRQFTLDCLEILYHLVYEEMRNVD